jgi:hypothetical protein
MNQGSNQETNYEILHKWKWDKIPKHVKSAKAIQREYIIVMNTCIKKAEWSQISNLSHFKKLETQVQTKLKISERNNKHHSRNKWRSLYKQFKRLFKERVSLKNWKTLHQIEKLLHSKGKKLLEWRDRMENLVKSLSAIDLLSN